MGDLKKYVWCAVAAIAVLAAGCASTGTQPGEPIKSAVPAVSGVDTKVQQTPTVVEVTKVEAPKPKEEPAPTPKAEPKATEATAVDISAAFNANAVGGEDGIDGWGDMYPADKMPTGNKAFGAGPMFSMPDFKAEKNVVTADGQTLTVPAGKYATLFVLAAATNGAQESPMQLAYGDAKVDATLKISDWCANAAFGETEAVTLARAGKNEVIDCKLFIQKIAIDATKDLTAITLPKNKDVHIFAMTLAK